MKIDPAVEAYLTRKKWSYSDKSPSQYVVKVCPFCGDRGSHFYVNKVTGQFLCWKCDEEGNQYLLKKKLGDISELKKLTPTKSKLTKKAYNRLRRRVLGYHNSLKADRKAQKIVKAEWGFGLRAIKRFKLGLQRKGKVNWLVMPQFEQKKLVNVKYRTLPPTPKRFRREEGLKSVLYNADNVDGSKKFINLFEGESDTITADTYLGIKNAVGVTVGARGFKPEWKDYLDQFEEIYICYDNDVVGQEGANKLAHRLGIHKCKNIELPHDEDDETESIDLNAWYQLGNTEEDFKTIVDLANPFDVEDVSNFATVLDDLEAELYFSKKLDQHGFLTQWENVNRLVAGFMPGDLVVLSGPAKIGKTTFALNILLHHAMQGIPVLDYCLEMRPERKGVKVIEYLRGIERSQISREDVIVVKSRFGRKPFYMAHSYRFKPEDVFETIRESVKRYGIEFMVFDHLHFLIREIKNLTAEVSATVREFKLMAEELKIPIVLICQPRKIGTARMTFNDLRDSSSIGQDADTVILLHRERIQQDENPNSETRESTRPVYKAKTEIIVDATRYNPGGVTTLQYNGAISRYFKNVSEERRFLDGGRNF
jgi:hypothetical protein